MMMGAGAGLSWPMPTLQTEEWKFAGKTPNPMSIRRARQLLAAGCLKMPCKEAGTGAHRCAWVAKKPEQWAARKGTMPIAAPETKPLMCNFARSETGSSEGDSRHFGMQVSMTKVTSMQNTTHQRTTSRWDPSTFTLRAHHCGVCKGVSE